MGDLHLLPLQRPRELHVVVAGQADRVAGGLHRHRQPQHRRRVRPAVAVVADEDRAAPARRLRGEAVVPDRVAELAEQRDQLGVAAVDVADHVEGARLGAAIGPERRPSHLQRLDLLRRIQHPDPVEALAAELLRPALQLRALLAHDVLAELPIGPLPVALHAHRLGQVEDDRHREEVVLAGQLEQRLARRALHVGRVDHGDPRLRQPLGGDEVEDGEGVGGRRLVVFVVGDEAAAEVRGDHLGRREVAPREGALARARRRRPAPPGSGPGCRCGSARRGSSGEHRHLGRRADLGIVLADRQAPHRVAVARGDGIGPGGELGARPLEAVVGVARGSRGEPRPAHVVLGVRGGDDDGAGTRVGEDVALQRAEPRPGRGARSPPPAPPRRSPPAGGRGRSAGSATARSGRARRRASSRGRAVAPPLRAPAPRRRRRPPSRSRPRAGGAAGRRSRSRGRARAALPIRRAPRRPRRGVGRAGPGRRRGRARDLRHSHPRTPPPLPAAPAPDRRGSPGSSDNGGRSARARGGSAASPRRGARACRSPSRRPSSAFRRRAPAAARRGG